MPGAKEALCTRLWTIVRPPCLNFVRLSTFPNCVRVRACGYTTPQAMATRRATGVSE